MTSRLPPVPARGALADVCREVAARENVQPYLIEKDFYLTRLLWALGDRFGEDLLLKGGTLLSKVDLGFFRMSEDADLVIPEAPSPRKSTNMKRINAIRDALTELELVVGAKRRFPGGEDSDKGAHRRWDLDYASEFGPQTIQLEVSLRPVLLPARRVALKQLAVDPLLGDYSEAQCWALDANEARAEKVRAAYTRDAIRDFYDLDRLASERLDLTSSEFLSLVDAKLKELHAPTFAEHATAFGMDESRRRRLKMAAKNELHAVLRSDAPAFDLDAMLAKFEGLWRH